MDWRGTEIDETRQWVTFVVRTPSSMSFEEMQDFMAEATTKIQQGLWRKVEFEGVNEYDCYLIEISAQRQETEQECKDRIERRKKEINIALYREQEEFKRLKAKYDR